MVIMSWNKRKIHISHIVVHCSVCLEWGAKLCSSTEAISFCGEHSWVTNCLHLLSLCEFNTSNLVGHSIQISSLQVVLRQLSFAGDNYLLLKTREFKNLLLFVVGYQEHYIWYIKVGATIDGDAKPITSLHFS